MTSKLESTTSLTTTNFSRRHLLKGAAGAAALAGMSGLPNLSFAADSSLKGESLHLSILGIAGWVPSSLGVKMSPIFAEYAKKQYGYDVDFSFADAPFSALFQKAATSLATRSEEYNIIISDSQWLGAFAKPKWVVKVSDLLKKEPSLTPEWYSPVISATYQTYPDGSDQLWGLPQEGDVIALYVRKDMLEDPAEQQAFKQKYNKDLPQTFDDFAELTMTEFENVAAFFTRPEKNLYGTAMQFSREYDFVSCFLYPFMWSRGGEIWDPKTGKVEGILNSKVNAEALEQMKHWLKYMPDGALNYGIAEEIDVFTQGKVFSCFQWAAVGPAMITDALKGKVMVVPPPKHGTGAEAKRVYTFGGQSWVINAFNDKKNMQATIDFMRWWYQPDVQLEYAKRGGNPCDKATLSRSDFDDMQPWFRTYKYMLSEGRSRDFWHHPKYAEMLSLQQEAFTSFMTGQTSDPQKVLDYVACKQQSILFQAGTAKEKASAACSSISL